MKRVLPSATILAAVLALAAPVVAQDANTVTITAAPAKVAYGKSATVSGTVTGTGGAGAEVELEAAPATGAFKPLTTGTTDASGNYAFPVTPTASTRYRATIKIKGKQTSPEATVLVALHVTRSVSDATPRRGQRVTFRGIVTPAHDGQAATLQRRTRDGWKTLKTTPLVAHAPLGTVARSMYSMRTKVRRTGTYRVLAASGDADHVDGKSRKRKLRVH